MRKQRMQADNVEQLMEIVRSLQQGEEPDMEKIREKTRQKELAAEAARAEAVPEKKPSRAASARRGKGKAESGITQDVPEKKAPEKEKKQERPWEKALGNDPALVKSKEAAKAVSSLAETAATSDKETDVLMKDFRVKPSWDESVFEARKVKPVEKITVGSGSNKKKEDTEAKKPEQKKSGDPSYEDDDEFEQYLEQDSSSIAVPAALTGLLGHLLPGKAPAKRREKKAEPVKTGSGKISGRRKNNSRKKKSDTDITITLEQDETASSPKRTEIEIPILGMEDPKQRGFEEEEEETLTAEEVLDSTDAFLEELDKEDLTEPEEDFDFFDEEEDDTPEPSGRRIGRLVTEEMRDEMRRMETERTLEKEAQERAELAAEKMKEKAEQLQEQKKAEQQATVPAAAEEVPEEAEQEPEETAAEVPVPEKEETEETSSQSAAHTLPDDEEEIDDFLDDEDDFSETEEKEKKENGGILAALAARGIQTKELIMLLAGAIVIVVLGAAGIKMISSGDRSSAPTLSANVSSDAGLTVQVKDSPKEWTESYPVKLKVKAGKHVPETVVINGESYEPDEKGIVEVQADTWLLEVEAEEESEVLSSRVEIPMIDGEAPVVEAKKEDGKVKLTAVDTRSSVKNIYYAVTDPSSYIDLPQYRIYKAPFKYQEGMIYRFYAEDEAGNCTVPSPSNLETARSIHLENSSIHLRKNHTAGLKVTAVPADSMIKNLSFKSSDESIARVSEGGIVTAVADGTVEIEVTADGVETQICKIRVGDERTVTLSVIGDCTLGIDPVLSQAQNFDVYQSMYGKSYFFSGVKDILSQDDVTFANMEGTLTTETTRAAKQYTFKGDPSYTEILTEGSVEVVTLANNHSRDYGEQSLEDTKKYLTEAGIDYCIEDTVAYRDVNGVKMAFIGIYELNDGLACEGITKQAIDEAKAQGAELIIVAFHWGTEKSNYPDSTMVTLGHAAIDYGADLVVGHHPHVLEGIEKYNDKYIVYSLGNFCFGGNTNPSDKDTMIFQQTFVLGANGKVSENSIQIIPCSVSSSYDRNDYKPMVLSGDSAQRVIDRINEYSASYGLKYTLGEGAGQ